MPQPRLRPSLSRLLKEVRACRVCADSLPCGPRPVLRAHQEARILIVGQAPGPRVHATGIPWNDASGDRLREWLDLDRETFYDERKFAIIPAGYCYPGRGKSGDLPPRNECSELWLAKLLAELPKIQLTLLIGQFAQRLYLGERRKESLTATVRAWREFQPRLSAAAPSFAAQSILAKKEPLVLSRSHSRGSRLACQRIVGQASA